MRMYHVLFYLAIPLLAIPLGGSALPSETSATVSSKRLTYYQQGLPQTQHLTQRSIPAEMLPPYDQSNNVYFEARDAQGRLVGYVRDFTGPVSPAAECPCNPLTLTLVFYPDYRLRTLLSPAPLEKYGHARMSPEEQAQLIEIAKNPPQALSTLPRVEDVVDATTGATQQELVGMVIPQAGLSTRRIIGLVQDTRRILQGAPVSRDRHRLEAILKTPGLKTPRHDLRKLEALADFLPYTESRQLKQEAYRLLVDVYTRLLTQQVKPSPPIPPSTQAKVEERLLSQGLDALGGPDMAALCYRLASQGFIKASFVKACVQILRAPSAPPMAMEHIQRLDGMAHWLEHDRAGALPPLKQAAQRINIAQDPFLHLRLSQALQQQGQIQEACQKARALVQSCPLLPGAKQALKACVADPKGMSQLYQTLQAQARRTLLMQARHPGLSVSPLTLENPQGQMETLNLYKPGYVTVVIFFATWCPHCQIEMPRINAFAQSFQNKAPKGRPKVQVIGIRTAVEQDTEPLDLFKKRLKLAFPIWTDPMLSMGFSRFTQEAHLPTSLPTTVVMDGQGVLRFVLPSGDWRDTAQELTWTVEQVLSEATRSAEP